MRVKLIYPEIRQGFTDFHGDYAEGVASILATLLREGHEVSFLHITQLLEKKTFIDMLSDNPSDLIAFSSMTNTFKYVRKYAAWAKSEFPTPIMCGGVHATLSPQEVIGLPYIDYICIGEGEESMAEFCRRWDKGEDITGIEGFWINTLDGLVKSPPRPLVENLDSLPIPARHLFDYENLLSSKEKVAYFMASRGCPFDCAYCANTGLRGIYPNRNKYIRFKSVRRVIDEIKTTLKHYTFIKYILFQDDILAMRKDWFREFAELYRKEINYPFYCNIYPTMVNEEVVELLKYAGCTTVGIGIESGNMLIRENVLNRNIPRDRIVRAFHLLRKKNIRTRSYNMVGLPFEDRSAIFDTIELNAEVRPDAIGVTIFYPYAATALYDVCQENNMLTGVELDTYYESSILRQKTLTNDEAVFSLRYFKLFVRLVQFFNLLPLPLLLRHKMKDVLRHIICARWLPLKILNSVSNKGYSLLRIVYVRFVRRFYSRRKKLFDPV